MSDLIEEFKVKNFKVELNYDPFMDSPRNFDTLGTIVYIHSGYILGDINLNDYMGETGEDMFLNHIDEISNNTIIPNRKEIDEFTEEEKEQVWKWIDENLVILTVYGYEHGNIMLNTKGFNCRFDSGQVGYIYVTKEDIKSEYGISKLTDEYIEKAKNVLNREIKEFSEYIQGNVYSYTVYDQNNEIYDIADMFYDLDECRDEAILTAEEGNTEYLKMIESLKMIEMEEKGQVSFFERE